MSSLMDQGDDTEIGGAEASAALASPGAARHAEHAARDDFAVELWWARARRKELHRRRVAEARREHVGSFLAFNDMFSEGGLSEDENAELEYSLDRERHRLEDEDLYTERPTAKHASAQASSPATLVASLSPANGNSLRNSRASAAWA